MDVLEKLNQACHDEGVCEPGIKHAAELWKEGSPRRIRVGVFEDGVVTSCVVELDDGGRTKSELCCYSTEPGQEAVFWPWIAHLSAVGYKEKRIDVENGRS